jgi:group I intron endonuclease
MKKYYIYLFLDKSKPGEYIYDDIKLNYEPFYVGKGTEDRIKSSMHDRESKFKINKIKSIINKGGEIISIKLYENLENIEALEIEKIVIKKIGRRDMNLGPLTNQTDGGDGRLTSPHNEETKLKISNTKKSQNLHIKHNESTKQYLKEINTGELNPMYGKQHTDKIKENQSLRVSGINHPMYGKKHSKETILKIKENCKNNQQKFIEMSKQRNNKSVLQFTLDMEFIDKYDSIKDAALKTGCSESIIGKCCRGIIKSPKKFIFKFSEEKSKILKNSYTYKIGDIITINNENYILVKRNKMSFVVEKEEKLLSFRKKDYPFIWEKKSI